MLPFLQADFVGLHTCWFEVSELGRPVWSWSFMTRQVFPTYSCWWWHVLTATSWLVGCVESLQLGLCVVLGSMARRVFFLPTHITATFWVPSWVGVLLMQPCHALVLREIRKGRLFGAPLGAAGGLAFSLRNVSGWATVSTVSTGCQPVGWQQPADPAGFA